MADGVNIDWGLLKTPDYIGDYQNAFEVGRQMAGQKIQANAMQAYAANPTGALDPRLAAVNPGLYGQVQDRQQAAQTQALTVQQAGAARDTAESFAAALQGLRMSTPDLNERLRIAQHVAPSLGIDPARITLPDVTDQGIAQHLATVTALQQRLTGLALPAGGANAFVPAAGSR